MTSHDTSSVSLFDKNVWSMNTNEWKKGLSYMDGNAFFATYIRSYLMWCLWTLFLTWSVPVLSCELLWWRCTAAAPGLTSAVPDPPAPRPHSSSGARKMAPAESSRPVDPRPRSAESPQTGDVPSVPHRPTVQTNLLVYCEWLIGFLEDIKW